MVNGAKRWCFTINNYTDESLLHLSLLSEETRVEYLVYGRELAPTTGTPHLQGFICLTTPFTLTALRALLPSCHLENARGTPEQNRTYCTKDGDFDEHGSLPSGKQGKRTDWTQFRDWCIEQEVAPTNRDLMLIYPSLWGRYPHAVRAMADELCPRIILRRGQLLDWQSELDTRLDGPSDDRSVNFYVDHAGNSGKSWYCGYLLGKRNDVQVLGPGKRDDLAYIVDVTTKVFLFNIPRGNMEYLNYGLLESLKDRMVMSTKYVPVMKLIRECPHVVVFCNEDPDLNKMSGDRYNITNM
jgi:hypothetical protein